MWTIPKDQSNNTHRDVPVLDSKHTQKQTRFELRLQRLCGQTGHLNAFTETWLSHQKAVLQQESVCSNHDKSKAIKETLRNKDKSQQCGKSLADTVADCNIMSYILYNDTK